MLNPKMITIASIALLAGACSSPYDRQASAPSGSARAEAVSRQNCIDYGFRTGTAAYERCVQRESNARTYGRVSSDYSEARLIQDARNACYDYGLERGSPRYDTCIVREVDARRYRESGQLSPQRSYARD